MSIQAHPRISPSIFVSSRDITRPSILTQGGRAQKILLRMMGAQPYSDWQRFAGDL